jgi:hypothetical protein
MKGGVLGGIVVAALAVVFGVCGMLFPYAKNSPSNVNAAYEKGFKYQYDLINKTPDEIVAANPAIPNTGAKILGHSPVFNAQTELKMRTVKDSKIQYPLFSDTEMNSITNRKNKLDTDYGFVMIDPSAGEFVEFAFMNPAISGVLTEVSPADLAAGKIGTRFTYNRGAEHWGGNGGIIQSHLLNNPLKTFVHSNPNNVYYNDMGSIMAEFTNEGYYEFHIECSIWTSVGGASMPISMDFGFYIVHKQHYDFNDLYIDGVEIDVAQGKAAGSTINGQYYNSYGAGVTYTSFNTGRYDVGVVARDLTGLEFDVFTNEFRIYDPATNRINWNFPRLGHYVVSAAITFYDTSRATDKLVMGRYSVHNFNLDVFGVEAYYENYDRATGADPAQNILGTKDINGLTTGDKIDANITPKINEARFNDTNVNGKFDDYWVQTRVNELNLLGSVATTNTPPVQLRGNVLSVEGQIFYNNTGLNVPGQWVEKTNFNIAKLYETAGEYFVIVNYKNENVRPEKYYQAFYFKITTTVNPRIEITKSNDEIETLYFNDYENNILDLSGALKTDTKSAVIYLTNGYSGATKLGPYERAPKSGDVQLIKYNWSGEVVPNPSGQNLSVDPETGAVYLPQRQLDDGVWSFRVKYGNNASAVSWVEFVIVVDKGMMNELKIKSTGTEHAATKAIEFSQIRYFGKGYVDISWAPKTSDQQTVRNLFPNLIGVGKYAATASVTRYPFVLNEDYYLNTSTPNKFTTNGMAEDIDAYCYMSMPEVQDKMEPTVSLNASDGRWHINHTFNLAGLYVAVVYDIAGNKNSFAFIIDDTKSGFAQSVAPKFSGADAEPNIIDNFDENVGITIGYGMNKIIKSTASETRGDDDYDTIEDILHDFYGIDVGPIRNILNGNEFFIGIKACEFSTDKRNYVGIANQSDFVKGDYYITVNREGFYFFQATDAVGNDSPWYIWLNRDKSKMMVLEDINEELKSSGLTANTNLVRPNGMATLPYVALSVKPINPDVAPEHEDYNYLEYAVKNYKVDTLKLTFYKLNFDKGTTGNINSNYPFARDAAIIDYELMSELSADEKNEPDKAAVIALNIINEATELGLYVITRTYEYQESDLAAYLNPSHPKYKTALIDRNDRVRDYLFIRDNNETIPIYAPAGGSLPFESDVKLEFGKKTADWHDFGKSRPAQQNERATVSVVSNAGAYLQLPQNKLKYGGSVGKTAGSITSLVNEKGSNVLNVLELSANAEFSDKGKSDIIYYGPHITDGRVDFDPTTGKSNPAITQNGNVPTFNDGGIYNLTVRDGSGSISWLPFRMDFRENPDNASSINFEVLTGFAPAFWYLNGTKLPFTRTSAKCRLNEQGQPLDNIQMVIENTGADFFVDINYDATTLYYFRGTGIGNTIFDLRPYQTIRPVAPSGEIITYNVLDAVNGAVVFMNMSISFDGYITDADGKSINQLARTLQIDNDAPKFNLGRLQSQDVLYNQKTMQSYTKDGNDYLDKYVYSMSSNFYFGFESILDTHRIEYSEIQSNLLTNGDYTDFSYIYTNGDITPFARLPFINLKNDEIRFFHIREYDEAENMTTYFVKLRGANVVDNISASGVETAIHNYGANNQQIFKNDRNVITNGAYLYGQDISVTDASNFWTNNPNFKINVFYNNVQQNNRTIKRFKFDTSVNVNSFESALNTILTEGRGKTIRLEIYDGNTAPRVVNITQCNSDTLPVNVVTSVANTVNLNVAIQNRSHIQGQFPYAQIGYTLNIYEIINAHVDWLNPLYGDIDFMTDRQFNGIGDKNLVIEVYDYFGRRVVREHHDERGSYYNIKYNGTSQILNGVRYVGHADGVTIEWNNATYELDLNGTAINVNNPEHVLKFGIQRTSTDIYKLSVLPFEKDREGGDSTPWRATFTYRVSYGVLQPVEWQFYHVLPKLVFRTIGGDGIPANKLNSSTETIDGMVEITLDRSGFLFSTSVSYTIQYNGKTETLPINKFATRFVLDRVGTYVISVSNGVSARKEYRLNIKEVDNLNFKIKFDGVEIIESPVQYKFTTDNLKQINIPVYWVKSSNINDIDVIETMSAPYNGVTNRLEVIPSLNHGRHLVTSVSKSFLTGGTIGDGAATAHYKFYYLESDTTGVRMYFALACSSGVPSDVYLKNGETTVTGIYDVYSFVNDGLNISLSKDALNNTDIRATNVYYIEYKQNGIVGGKSIGKNILKIEKQDYGVIELAVRDWAGNEKRFTDAFSHNLGYFTIYNFSTPPVLINGETIIDEMLYNDAINLSIITEFPDFMTDAINYCYIVRDLKIWRDDELVENYENPANAKHDAIYKNFTATGRYTIECEYVAYNKHAGRPMGMDIVRSVHTVNLVNTSRFLQAYTFSGASNIKVQNITHGAKNDVTRQFGEAPMQNFMITSAHADGRYRITFLIEQSNLRDAFVVTREVFIASIDPNPSIVVAKLPFGEKHKKSVEIVFNPLQVMRACNNSAAYFVVYKDGFVMEVIDVRTNMTRLDGENVIPVNIDEDYSYIVSGEGSYIIEILAASDMTRVFSDGFIIEKESNKTMLYIGFGALGFVGVGILLFVRMRHGMRVK